MRLSSPWHPPHVYRVWPPLPVLISWLVNCYNWGCAASRVYSPHTTAITVWGEGVFPIRSPSVVRPQGTGCVAYGVTGLARSAVFRETREATHGSFSLLRRPLAARLPFRLSCVAANGPPRRRVSRSTDALVCPATDGSWVVQVFLFLRPAKQTGRKHPPLGLGLMALMRSWFAAVRSAVIGPPGARTTLSLHDPFVTAGPVVGVAHHGCTAGGPKGSRSHTLRLVRCQRRAGVNVCAHDKDYRAGPIRAGT